MMQDTIMKQKILTPEATPSDSPNVVDILHIPRVFSYTHYLLQEPGVGKDLSKPPTSSAQLWWKPLDPVALSLLPLVWYELQPQGCE